MTSNTFRLPTALSLAVAAVAGLALQASAGSWRGRAFTGAEFVDAARSDDLDERLRRLGLA